MLVSGGFGVKVGGLGTEAPGDSDGVRLSTLPTERTAGVAMEAGASSVFDGDGGLGFGRGVATLGFDFSVEEPCFHDRKTRPYPRDASPLPATRKISLNGIGNKPAARRPVPVANVATCVVSLFNPYCRRRLYDDFFDLLLVISTAPANPATTTPIMIKGRMLLMLSSRVGLWRITVTATLVEFMLPDESVALA